MSPPWYTNPAWYALIVSVVALAISVASYIFTKRAKEADIRQALIRQAVEINEGFARHGIKSPYGHHLGISEDQVAPFTAKAAVFLNQVNLLRAVYDARRILGSGTEAAYLKWASDIVRPWLEADPQLRDVWKLLRDSEDLVGKDFVRWLSPHFPIFK